MIKIVKKLVGQKPEVAEMSEGLNSMKEIVGGHIELVSLPNDIDMWLNEEGLLINLPINVITYIDNKQIHQIMGNIFFSSHDDEGNTTSLNQEQIDWIFSRTMEIGVSTHENMDNKAYSVYGIVIR